VEVTGGRAEPLRLARTVLAADCACPEAALVEEGLLITKAEEREGRRRYPMPAKPLLVVTMGAGVVVSCHPERVDWLESTLGHLARDAIYSAAMVGELARVVARDGQQLRGPNVKYVCAAETFRPADGPLGVAITVAEGEAVAEFYRYEGFPNALSYRRDHPRPDVAAAVASRAGVVLGIAGMSDDCESLWQIGVDVVPSARGQGIGRALVGRLTDAAFRRGRVPYYAAAISNVRSSALAIGLGYWPAWCEMSARDAVPSAVGSRA
jgi:GNAT superfamily N-acetyltransferase